MCVGEQDLPTPASVVLEWKSWEKLTCPLSWLSHFGRESRHIFPGTRHIGSTWSYTVELSKIVRRRWIVSCKVVSEFENKDCLFIKSPRLSSMSRGIHHIFQVIHSQNVALLIVSLKTSRCLVRTLASVSAVFRISLISWACCPLGHLSPCFQS